MVTADGDMWTALAVKVMGGQVPVRDLGFTGFHQHGRVVVRDLRGEVFGLLGHIEIQIERVIPWSCHYPQKNKWRNRKILAKLFEKSFLTMTPFSPKLCPGVIVSLMDERFQYQTCLSWMAII